MVITCYLVQESHLDLYQVPVMVHTNSNKITLQILITEFDVRSTCHNTILIVYVSVLFVIHPQRLLNGGERQKQV